MAAAAIDDTHRRPPWVRTLPFLHLLGLVALAVAQPLFDLLGRHPELFVVRGLRPLDVWLLAPALVLLPAAPLLLARGAAALAGERAALHVQGFLVGSLVLAIGLQALRQLAAPGLWLPVAPALAALTALLYLRSANARFAASLLSLAAVLLPVYFLAQPGVRGALADRGAEVPLHASGATAPVLVLVLDELSLPSLLDAEGTLDARRFPHLAAFAATATWYPDAAAVSDDTQKAVPALLTGRYPRPGQLPALAHHPRNLFTLFGRDYDVHAEEALTRLCPPQINRLERVVEPWRARWKSLLLDLGVIWLHVTLPAPASERLPPITHAWGGFVDGGGDGAGSAPPPGTRTAFHLGAVAAIRDRGERIAPLVAALGPGDRALYFVHLPFPHVPWEHYPSGTRYLRARDLAMPRDETWPADGAGLTQAYVRYQLQAMYADRLVGRFLDRLRELGAFERALVAVTADHGAAFRPGSPRRRYSPETAAEVVAVPLLIKAPFQSVSRIDPRPVSTVDLLPTMLELLDVPAPDDLDGVSAVGAAPPRRRYFLPRSGEPVTVPPLGPAVAAEARRLRRLAGDAASAAELLRSGPYPGLVGRALAELPVVGPGAVEVALDAPERFAAVDPGLPPLPLLVSGTLRGQDTECCHLAVGVGGVVRATTTSLRGPDGTHRWSALLPEDALEAGSNEVVVLLVRGDGAGGALLERPRLRRRTSYRLDLGAGGEVAAVVVDGVPFRIAPELEGRIDAVRVEGGQAWITGWAADLVGRGPAEEVAFFHRGAHLGSTIPAMAQGELARLLGDEAFVESRFAAAVRAPQAESLRRHGIRAFALSPRGTAWELRSDVLGVRRLPDGAEALTVADGRLVPVTPGAVLYRLEAVRRAAGEVVLAGWVADAPRRQPVARLAALAGDRAAAEAPVDRRRTAAAEVIDGVAAAASYAFELRVPAAAAQGGALRLFALTRDHAAATELSPSDP